MIQYQRDLSVYLSISAQVKNKLIFFYFKINDRHKTQLGVIRLIQYLNPETSPNISLYKQALVEMTYAINCSTWHMTMSPFHISAVVMTLHTILTASKAELIPIYIYL